MIDSNQPLILKHEQQKDPNIRKLVHWAHIEAHRPHVLKH